MYGSGRGRGRGRGRRCRLIANTNQFDKLSVLQMQVEIRQSWYLGRYGRYVRSR